MVSGIGRRQFMSGVGGVAVAWPLAARAQQASKLPTIGYMHAGTAQETNHQTIAFQQGLRQVGYIDGQNVAIEYRWADFQYDRLPTLAAELVRRQVSVLATGTPVAALAAKQVTASIPIVFAVGSDPVKDGLVATLNKPGGNITGATFFSNLLTAKRFGLLHELVPNAKSFLVLVNPKNANAQMQTSEAQQAASDMTVSLLFINASTEDEIEKNFDNLGSKQVDALIVLSDALLNNKASQISKLALRHGLPTCFSYREPVVAGGLMGYGASVDDASRQAGNYVGRILKGEKPVDLPVQQPTRFEFVINLKTAKALGLTIPESFLVRADEVIE